MVPRRQGRIGPEHQYIVHIGNFLLLWHLPQPTQEQHTAIFQLRQPGMLRLQLRGTLQKLAGIDGFLVCNALLRKVEIQQRQQQRMLPIADAVRRPVFLQLPQCCVIIPRAKLKPGQLHAPEVGGNRSLFLQEIAHGKPQPPGKILQRGHGGSCGIVLDLGQHVAGDLIAAELPLAEPGFHACLAQLFSQGHGLLLL